MTKRLMITVLDSINQTTMPYNEFILYRNKHYIDERQVLLLTGNEIAIPQKQIPENLEIHKVGKNPFRIRKKLKNIIREGQKNHQEIVVHLHSIRGSFSTLLAMMGLGLRACTIYSIHSTFPGFRFHNKVFCLMDVLFSNHVTCVSNTSYSRFPSPVKLLKGEKMQALQNGVNEERIEEIIAGLKKNQDTDRPLKFIYVARLIPLKNHKFLVDVLSTLPKGLKVKFVFVGMEDTTKTIRLYAEEKGVIDRIEFTGLIPREEVYPTLFNSDVYISSSTLEGLPVSVLEGMYCGLPAILSNIPQHKEVAKGCESVSLLPYEVEVWVKKIKELSDLSDIERQNRGNISRNFVSKHFSLWRMHKEYDNIYNQIVKQL